MRTLGAALSLSGRAHPGRVARVVLTGLGGGTWTVPLAWGEPADADADADTDLEPDLELRVDVVAWCRVASERLEPEALAVEAQGDGSLVADLLVAASVFATL